MAMLQFISAGLDKVAIPTTIHCDHLTMAEKGLEVDIAAARIKYQEVFEFLESAASRCGIGSESQGLESFIPSCLRIMLCEFPIDILVCFTDSFSPGGLLVGTGFHTPNATGMAMLGIGVGGSDMVYSMPGQEWELSCPQVHGVRLKGKLSGWASSKGKPSGLLNLRRPRAYSWVQKTSFANLPVSLLYLEERAR